MALDLETPFDLLERLGFTAQKKRGEIIWCYDGGSEPDRKLKIIIRDRKSKFFLQDLETFWSLESMESQLKAELTSLWGRATKVHLTYTPQNDIGVLVESLFVTKGEELHSGKKTRHLTPTFMTCSLRITSSSSQLILYLGEPNFIGPTPRGWLRDLIKALQKIIFGRHLRHVKSHSLYEHSLPLANLLHATATDSRLKKDINQFLETLHVELSAPLRVVFESKNQTIYCLQKAKPTKTLHYLNVTPPYRVHESRVIADKIKGIDEALLANEAYTLDKNALADKALKHRHDVLESYHHLSPQSTLAPKAPNAPLDVDQQGLALSLSLRSAMNQKSWPESFQCFRSLCKKLSSEHGPLEDLPIAAQIIPEWGYELLKHFDVKRALSAIKVAAIEQQNPRILAKLSEAYRRCGDADKELDTLHQWLTQERRLNESYKIALRRAEIMLQKDQSEMAARILLEIIETRCTLDEEIVRVAARIAEKGLANDALDILHRIHVKVQEHRFDYQVTRKDLLNLVLSAKTYIWTEHLGRPEVAVEGLTPLLQQNLSPRQDRGDDFEQQVEHAEKLVAKTGAQKGAKEAALLSQWTRWSSFSDALKRENIGLGIEMFHEAKSKNDHPVDDQSIPSKIDIAKRIAVDLVRLNHPTDDILQHLTHAALTQDEIRILIDSVLSVRDESTLPTTFIVYLARHAREDLQDHQKAVELLSLEGLPETIDQPNFDYLIEKLHYSQKADEGRRLITQRILNSSTSHAQQTLPLAIDHNALDGIGIFERVTTHAAATGDSGLLQRLTARVIKNHSSAQMMDLVTSMRETLPMGNAVKPIWLVLFESVSDAYSAEWYQVYKEIAACYVAAESGSLESATRVILNFSRNGIYQDAKPYLTGLILANQPSPLDFSITLDVLDHPSLEAAKYLCHTFQTTTQPDIHLDCIRLLRKGLLEYLTAEERMEYLQRCAALRQISDVELHILDLVGGDAGEITKAIVLETYLDTTGNSTKPLSRCLQLADCYIHSDRFSEAKHLLENSLVQVEQSVSDHNLTNTAQSITDILIRYQKIPGTKDDLIAMIRNLMSRHLKHDVIVQSINEFAIQNGLASKQIIYDVMTHNALTGRTAEASEKLVKLLSKPNLSRHSVMDILKRAEQEFNQHNRVDLWYRTLTFTIESLDQLSLSKVVCRELTLTHHLHQLKDERPLPESREILQAYFKKHPDDQRVWLPLYFLLLEQDNKHDVISLLEIIIPKLVKDPTILASSPTNLESLKANLTRLKRVFSFSNQSDSDAKTGHKKTPLRESSVGTQDSKLRISVDTRALPAPLPPPALEPVARQHDITPPINMSPAAIFENGTAAVSLDQPFISERESPAELNPTFKDAYIDSDPTHHISKDLSPETKPAVAWRDIARTLVCDDVAPDQIMKQAFAHETEKHMALQVAALLSGDFDAISDWHWKVWEPGGDYGYSLKSTPRMAQSSDLIELKKPLYSFMMALNQPLLKVFKQRFTVQAAVGKKLGSSSIATKPVSINHPTLARSGISRYIDLLTRERVAFMDTPQLKSDLWFDPTSRTMHFSLEDLASKPASFVLHRLRYDLYLLKSNSFAFMNLDFKKDLWPIMTYLERQDTKDVVSRLKFSFTPGSNQLAAVIPEIERKRLHSLLQSCGDVTEEQMKNLQADVQKQTFRLLLAGSLNLVGLVETVLGQNVTQINARDLQTKIKASKILRDLFDYATKLNF